MIAFQDHDTTHIYHPHSKSNVPNEISFLTPVAYLPYQS